MPMVIEIFKISIVIFSLKGCMKFTCYRKVDWKGCSKQENEGVILSKMGYPICSSCHGEVDSNGEGH